MKVSLIQSSIEWLNPVENRMAAQRWIAECEGSDLVIFPEMFTTGFCMEPTSMAESNGETLEWMVSMAKRYDVAIAGSVAVEEGGRYYNRLYLVKRDGAYVKYDKRHLFTFAGEDKVYSFGNERVVVDVDGVRILLLICYDLRFPVWMRNRGDYDMVLCVANWPKARREPWDILLRARAIENLSYVCGVNIIGDDTSCHYSGGTAVVDFKGNVVSSVADDCDGVATFELDMDGLSKFRSRFPALNDADDFEI